MSSGSTFVPGMRIHGECPKHAGQPYYHCPQCSLERRQSVGRRIAETLIRPSMGGGDTLSVNPSPVYVSRRAADQLLAYVRDYKRHHLPGKIASLQSRLTNLSPDLLAEREATEQQLSKLLLQAEEQGLDIDGFDVVVLVFLDVTGISGVHPKIELAEPATVKDFDTKYNVYTVGSLKIAVELHNMNYLRGLIIEWLDRLDCSGFVIRHQKGDWSVNDR